MKKENKNIEFEDHVEGRNSVLELLDSGKDINKIYITKGEKHGSINKIIQKAKDKKVIIIEKDRRQMDKIAENTNYQGYNRNRQDNNQNGQRNYQGVIAIVPPYEYCDVEDILKVAKERNEIPFILILDGIEDPHNLGSIIRTAETAGVHGIIIPKRRSASVNSTVNKTSAGAVEYMKIARVTNISDTIEMIKKEGLWIIGTDINTNTCYDKQDYNMPIAIVIGNEGRGISNRVKNNCDFLVKIPMNGKITSLNASVSAGIIMYKVVEARRGKKL